MPIILAPVPLLVFRQEVRSLCKAVYGHESIITWSFRARQEDKGTSAHNMGTCPLARLSLLSMLNHGFVIEAVHGHESNITWSPRARQEDMGTGAHNMGTCPLARLSPRG